MRNRWSPSLPYQASCSAIAARIQELVDGGELDGIADVNDNSSPVVKPSLIHHAQARCEFKRRNEQLVQDSRSLQTSFPVNMVALVDGVPRTVNLR